VFCVTTHFLFYILVFEKLLLFLGTLKNKLTTMKKLLFLIFLALSLNISAQNSHVVSTSGNSFAPNLLNISVGDTVTWVNTGGWHNVNATLASYPNNPEGFGNAVAGAGWSFQWIFTIAGTYNYQCDPHVGYYMFGSVNVSAIPIFGCTDVLASNYDPLANNDDGSCDYTSFTIITIGSTFSPDTIICDVGDTINFILGGYHNAVEVSNSTWLVGGTTSNSGFSFGYGATGQFIPTNAQTYYYVCQPHVTSGMKGVIIANALPISGCTDSTACNYNSAANSDDGSCDLPNGCGDPLYIEYNSTVTCSDSSACLNLIVNGCTDSTATNYNALATVDDGSCIIPVYGCTGPSYCNYDPLATMDDGSCAGMSGCTDPLYVEYSSIANCDDGSCLTLVITNTCSNPSPTNAYISELIHDRARVNWDNMNDANCMVNQYRIRYRAVGSSSWSSKTMSGSGLCVFGLNTASKKILGLTPSTTYEYYMKAWYCGGGVSGWSSIQNFTTADECQGVINFAVTSPTTTKATFTWDTTAAYSFARIKLRPDTTNAVWTTAGGFGVFYPLVSKSKNGLTPGQTYRASSRTWCDPTGGTYRSAGWTFPIFWTQPTSIRLEGGSAINNLDVYPNPSRDIFNVSFTSEDAQDLKVRVLNLIGEELINENLQQFIGEYSKQINLGDNAKGIYFLEIVKSDGIINKKLIVQ
jgi:plastocyanin